MIATVNYRLGGWDSPRVYSDEIYKYERGTKVYGGNPTSWTGKIALMHASDYGYAIDFTKCTQNLYTYDDRACQANDWLYNKDFQWLLTPFSGNSMSVGRVDLSGGVNFVSVYSSFRIQPVLYLNSETNIEAGNIGTSENPYRISVG